MPRETLQWIVQLKTRPDRPWSDYVRLREQAEASRKLQDGIAAGRAWARLIDYVVLSVTGNNGSGQ
jgi:hypothetical protein